MKANYLAGSIVDGESLPCDCIMEDLAIGAPSQDFSTVRDLTIMAKAENYHHWIFDQFKPFIGSRVLEVGAGIGTYTEMMTDKDVVIPIDNDPCCLRYLLNRFAANNNVSPHLADITNPNSRHLSELAFNTMLCINVLEHIRDDQETLLKMNRLLDKGGRMLLLVPAHQALFGTIDISLGHYRRYTKKGLCDLLEAADFRIKELFHMNLPATIGWLVNNRILDRAGQSDRQVRLYDSYVVPLASRIENIIKPPFGLSIVAIAKEMRKLILQILLWLYGLSVVGALRKALKQYPNVAFFYDNNSILPSRIPEKVTPNKIGPDSLGIFSPSSTVVLISITEWNQEIMDRLDVFSRHGIPIIYHYPTTAFSELLSLFGWSRELPHLTRHLPNILQHTCQSNRGICRLSSNSCEVNITISPFLIMAILAIFLALKFMSHETLPADDLARHCKAFLYGYDFRNLFPYSYHPSFNTYIAFDILASSLYRLLRDGSYLVLQLIPLLLTSLSLRRMMKGTDDNMISLTILLMFCFTWGRFVSGRPCVFESSAFLMAYAYKDDIPAIGHFLIGLLMGSFYYLFFLYTTPFVLFGRRKQRIAYFVSTVLAFAGWYIYSHGEYFEALLSLVKTAFVFQQVEYSELKPIFPGGLVVFFAALSPLLLYFRRNLTTAAVSIYFMLFNQVRFFETIVPLTSSFLKYATGRVGALAVTAALSVALLQVRAVPHVIPPLPSGSIVLTSSSIAMNSVVMASGRVGVVPSPNLGWNEPKVRDAVERMTAEGLLDCSLFNEYNFDYVVEDRLTRVPQCLSLQQMADGYRIWKVSMHPDRKATNEE